MRGLLINILTLMFLALPVQGTVYYVSTTGSDLADGLSEGAAWASINRGEQLAILNPGDTVNILPGLYNPTGVYQLLRSGSAGSPITYRNYGSGSAVINGSLSGGHVFEILGAYVTIEGLEIHSGGSKGIRITSSNCVVRGCYIHDVDEEGIESIGTNNFFVRNIIASTGKEGILVDGEDNASYHNTVYYPGENGIEYKGGVTDGRIFNNIVVGATEGIRGKSTVIAGFNDLWLNSSNYTDGISDSAGGLLANPLFVNAAGGDFSLQAGSPCINAGMWLDYPYYAAAPDIGAFELLQIGGTSYYVKPTGNDGASGLSEAYAWASIDNGDVLGILLPGDTVNILAGAYTVTDSIFLHTSGAAAYKVTYREVSDSVQIDGSTASGMTVVYIRGSNTVVSGLTIDSPQWDGIWIAGDSNLVTECWIREAGGDAIDVGGYNYTAHDNLVLKNLTIANSESGVEIDSTTTQTKVYNNTVQGSTSTGVNLLGSAGSTRVFNNIIVQNQRGIVGVAGNVCGYNDVWSNTLGNYSGGVADSAGGKSINPVFQNASGNDYSLKSTSPVIDSGLYMGFPYYGNAPDMGALEYVSNAPPEITVPGPVSVAEGDNVNFQITATDDLDIPALTSSTLPTGASFVDNGDGTADFDWTPGFLQSGVYNIWFYATDDSSAVDSGSVTITVAEVGNQAPVLASIGARAAAENIALSFSVSATDIESTPTLSTSTLPTGASFVDNGNGTGDFDWTPTFLQSGSYDVTFYATDDSLAIDSEVVTITVAEAGNRDPILTFIGAKSVDEWALLAFGVTATDVESTPTLTTSTLPWGADFDDNGDGTGDFDWRPNFLQSGVYHVTFYATDDSLAVDSEVVTIVVGEVGNQPPTLTTIGAQSATENAVLNFGITASDIESTPSLTTSTLPSGAGFVDNGDGTGDFDWTPDFLQSGSYNVTFYATDDSLEVDSEVVTITVNEAGNQPPVLSPISDTSTSEWVNLTFGVSASDIESVPSLTTSSLPPGTDFTDNGDGTGVFDWTPQYPQAGSYTITFYAEDDSLAVDSAEVLITVDSTTTAYIEVSPDTATVSTDSTLDFTTAGFNAGGQQSRHGTVTWSLTNALGVIDSTGLFEPDTPGTTRVIGVSSLGLTDTSGTITVVVGELAVLTVAPDSVEITTDSTATFTVTGTDVDGNAADIGTISWSLTDSIGIIDSAGVFTPTAAGTTRVVATSSPTGVADTNQILIVDPGLLTRIEVSPNADTLVHGDSVQFTVIGYDAVNSPTPTGPIDWAVLGQIGTIDTAGWFRATGSGTGYIIPTSGLYGLADTTEQILVEALTIEPIALGNSLLRPGEKAHPILAFKLENDLSYDLEIEGITLRDASRGAGLLPERLSNMDSIAVYRDTDSDAALTAADALLAQATMVADTVHLDFAPVTIHAASSETFLVGVNASLYPRDGDSLDIYLLSGTDIATVGDSTIIVGVDSVNSSGRVLIDGLVSAQVSLTTTSVATISPADSAWPVLAVDLPRNGYSADTLNALSVVNLGSAGHADLDSLILFRDNNTGVWEGAADEVRVSRLWYTGGQWTGSGLTQVLTEQTTRFYVGAYLAAYPINGATVSLTIPQNGLIMSSQNDGPLDATPEAPDTIAIATNEAVTLEAVALPSLSLVPGLASAPLTGFDITNSYAVSVGIDSLRYTLYAGNDVGASQVQLDSQIDSLRLYLNRDNDHTRITALDTLLAMASVVNGKAVFAVDGLNLAGGGGRAGLSVVALMDLRNCKNANTINVGLADSTDLYLGSARKIEGTFPQTNAAAHTISSFPAEAIAVNVIEGATLYGAQTNQVVFDFELPRNGYAADHLRDLTISNAGTVRTSEALSRCRLFADASGDGFTVDDPLVGQFAYVNGNWLLPGMNYLLSNVLTRFFVVVDITSDQSAGGTLQFQIPAGGVLYGSGTTGPDDLAVGNPETHLVFPSNRVTAISIPDITRPVYPGSTENVLLTYALYNGYVGLTRSLKSITVTNLTRSASDAAFADSELGQVSLFYDADNNRALDGDSLVASGYFSDGRLVFSGLNVALPAESLSYFFVAADIPLNSIDADSLAVSIDGPSDFSFSEETIVNGDLPLASGGFLVVDGSVTAQYTLQGLVPRTLKPGDTSVTLFAFRPAINGDRIDTLQAVTITNLLDATSADIDPLEIWLDVNLDGIWQASDSLLAAATYASGIWTVSGLEVEVSEGNRPTIFAVGDVSATATPNAAFKAALPENGCMYKSGNDGPIDDALEGTNTFTVSNSGLRVSFPPLGETYSVGQTIQLNFTATNVQTVTMSDVSGKVAAVSDPSRVVLVDSVVGPLSLPAGGSGDFSFQYTALQPGEVFWQVRAVAPSFPDSSALIQTNTVSIQAAPSNVTPRLVNSIPTAVTRGQTNVFPMTVKFAHPDTTAASASLRIDSLRILVEDGDENPLPANEAFSRLVLASGYSNLSIINSVPAQSSLSLVFTEPVLVAPGDERSFSLLVDIDSSATATNFALAVESALALPIVDGNTLEPVTINPTIVWPLRTASCRIENPSQAGAVSYVPLLKPQVNYGQMNVPMLQLNLRHPGAIGSSQIQLTKVSFMIVDDSGVAFSAAELFDDIRLLKQQTTIASASGSQLEPTLLDMPLSSPLTLSAGQIDSVTIVASIKPMSAVTGFCLLVSDSTQLVIRDVSSGFRLDALTDDLSTSTFPASSGFARLRERALPPEVCIQSLLPGSIIGGVDSLDLVEYRLIYRADENSSPIRLDRAGLVALDSAGTPLDPTRLFDRIGYRLEGGAIQYQTFVQMSDGATVVNFADTGLLLQPGDSLTLELVADIEADVPYDNFLLQARFDDALSLCDATDTTQSPGIFPMDGCAGGIPYSTGVTEIFLAAGRPGVRAEEPRILMAYPGQSGLNVFEGDLSYVSDSPQGDLSLGGLHGKVLQRTTAGLVPARGADLFAAVTLMLDGSPVAVDSLLDGDSIVCRLDSEFSLSRGNTLSLALTCDLRPDAALGNYVIRFDDSTFFEVSDKNLLGTVYPTLTGAAYPVLSAELSVSAAGLESSFTNYPNPFNPSRGEETIIGFALDEPGQVDIELFTITGEAVRNVITNAYRAAGTHQSDTWSGDNDKGREVVPGTYFCRITVKYASGRTESFRRKIAVVR